MLAKLGDLLLSMCHFCTIFTLYSIFSFFLFFTCCFSFFHLESESSPPPFSPDITAGLQRLLSEEEGADHPEGAPAARLQHHRPAEQLPLPEGRPRGDAHACEFNFHMMLNQKLHFIPVHTGGHREDAGLVAGDVNTG